MRCSHCGSTKFDEDRARADLVCLDCGMVISQNAISSEVEFIDTGTGVAAAVGRFVSDESQIAGHESRQVTEHRARRRIDTICGHLRLGGDIATSAFRYYQSALFRGITRGRGALQVAAGCVYLAARQLHVNLMLLDLSDAVGINVYVLGHCYSDLKRHLHLSIPEMDPCLYIERFASQLEFGDKMPAVATTAMRLLQRMKKDWLATGRRPSGLAAAALLVAARIHEFNRNEEDVARIARISQQTARKRLDEFGRTPTSALSIEDFFAVDYEEEQDPPAFSASKKSDEAVKELDETAFAKISAEINELERRIDCELHALAEKRSCRLFLGKLSELDVGQSKGIQYLLEESSDISASPRGDEDSNTTRSDASDISQPTKTILREVLDGIIDPQLLDNCAEDLHILTRHSGEEMCQLLQSVEEARNEAEINGDPRNASESTDDKPDGVKQPKLPLFIPEAVVPKSEFPDTTDGTLSLEGIDDAELEQEYLLHPREVMIKAAIWYKCNAEYLHSARRKRLAKKRQQEEDAKNPRKRRTRSAAGQRRSRAMNKYDSRDKFEPVAEESEDKPISSKINYEALEALVGFPSNVPSSSFVPPSTPGPSMVSDPSAPIRPGPLLASTLVPRESASTCAQSELHPRSSILTRQDAVKAGGTKSVAFAEPGFPIGSVADNVVTQPAESLHQNADENEEEDVDGEEDEEAGVDLMLDDDDDDDLAWQQGAELW
ncbi:unnamed protein product [Dicrocoelium dendriticum]|nr:unnamed protein product [Dicrocoelium dendriticum]